MVYPNPQIYPSLKAIFVHVPKTAGTSIERALLLGEDRVVGGHTTAKGYQSSFSEQFSNYYKFSVVRDPVDRFASAYYYLRQNKIHPALNNQLAHDCDTVDEFACELERAPHLIERTVHLLPQYKFVCDDTNKILVDEIYNYDDLKQCWENLLSKLNVDYFPLPVVNVSKRPSGSEYSNQLIDFVRHCYSTDYEIFKFSR